MIEKGKWNHAIGCFGVPGSGKSTYALAQAIELGRCSYVLAHDPGYRLPERFPNGTLANLKRHDSVASAKAALASDPKGVHSIACLDAGEVIALARQVADTSLRRYGGKAGIPVTVLIDEAVSARDAGVYRLGEDLRQLLALRRHMHVGLIYTVQSPRLCHNQLLSLSTELVSFRLNDGRDFRKLQDVGFTQEEINKIAALPPYQHVNKRLN